MKGAADGSMGAADGLMKRAVGLVVILDGSLFYVTVTFSFLLVYDTSKKKVVFSPLKLKA